MIEFIKIRIAFGAATESGQPIDSEQAQDVVDQIREDALVGTFSSLDARYWASRMERKYETLSRARLTAYVVEGKTAKCEFELELADDLFPADRGGLQHLLGIVAGDLLQFTLPPIKIEEIKVRAIELTSGFLEDHRALFRKKSNTIPQIRQMFRLENGMPLLAFSFKPRIGFALRELEAIANQVLDEGFNVVELDTRYLARDATILDELLAIAKRVAESARKKHGQVARLSLNLSLPPDLMLEAAERLKADIPPPVLFKIDGGFDGFSGLQCARRKLDFSPIITCYPLLRSAFKHLIPSDTFVEGLALSGADIIYVGGRPDVGASARSFGVDGASLASAVDRYRSFVEVGWPMPSIAGGIYAGQLQAYYELLGPNVAWFLGGGVALHEDGPGAGARLCHAIAAASAEKRQSAGSDWADNIKNSLIQECDTYNKTSSLGHEQLRYVSPKENFQKLRKLKPIGAINL